MAAKLINVSNRLPVTVTDEEIAKSSGGLVAALEGLSKSDYEIQWIGWPGAAFADLRSGAPRLLRWPFERFNQT